MKNTVHLYYKHLSRNTEDILHSHAAFYPLIQPSDAVKLLYQAAFGPGHMIVDREAAYARTKQEIGTVTEVFETCDAHAPFEKIGGGYVRMYLPPKSSETSDDSAALATLLFVKSAADTRNRKDYFLDSLESLRSLTDKGIFSFSRSALDTYLASYLDAGAPAVSHSDTYRNAYHPAYRVIRQDYAMLYPVIHRLYSALSAQKTSGRTVACFIDGKCGAGKSTLAALLADLFDARVIHMDDFFLPPEKRTPERLAEPGGNVDYERFHNEVMEHLDDDSLTYGLFDCSKMAVTSQVSLTKTPLTIIEGSYSCHPYFDDAGTHIEKYRVFVECEPDEQKRRILERNGQAMLERFVSRWIPMEDAYAAAFDLRANTDFIIHT